MECEYIDSYSCNANVDLVYIGYIWQATERILLY